MAARNIDLTGRGALVTGASRGIGAGVAEMLAAHGARVAVHYGTDQEAAAVVLGRLPGEGHTVLAADLGDPVAAGALAGQGSRGAGRLDIVVNNAGIFVTHDIADLDQSTGTISGIAPSP